MACSNSSNGTYLLLLPSIPSGLPFQYYEAAYGPSLSAVFSDVLAIRPRGSPVAVDIALACPYLCNSRSASRSSLFDETQTLLSSLYRLICVLTARSDNVDDANRIDARIIIIAYAYELQSASTTTAESDDAVQGPVVSLTALAKSRKSLQLIYYPDYYKGDLMRRKFLLHSHTSSVKEVPCGSLPKLPETYISMKSKEKSDFCRKHYSVAVGGTFDHLHIGHKLLLTMTAFLLDTPVEYSKKPVCMTVGISGETLLKNKKFASVMESWRLRQTKVVDFIQSLMCIDVAEKDIIDDTNHTGLEESIQDIRVRMRPNMMLKCVELRDPCGPTINEEAISALVASAETQSGGHVINSKRAQRGWAPLDIYEVSVIEPPDKAVENQDSSETSPVAFQGKLSSTEIRRQIYEKMVSDDKRESIENTA